MQKKDNYKIRDYIKNRKDDGNPTSRIFIVFALLLGKKSTNRNLFENLIQAKRCCTHSRPVLFPMKHEDRSRGG